MKEPPVAIEAERAVLGAILLNPEALAPVMDRLGETGTAFHVRAHGQVYAGMLAVTTGGQPLDVMSLQGHLQARGELEGVGGVSYLAELLEAVPTSANAGHYADLVKEAWTRRRLMLLASELSQRAPKDAVSEVVGDVEASLLALSRGVSPGPVALKDVVGAAVDNILRAYDQRGLVGVSTGMETLDRLLGGLRGGQYYIVAGPTGGGKTAFALHLMRAAALKQQKKVLYFSLEMTATALTERLLFAEGGVRLSDVVGRQATRADVQKRLLGAMAALEPARVEVDAASPMTPAIMRSRCRHEAMRGPLGLVVVDYLQLMTAGGRFDNRTQEVSAISGAVKGLSLELDCPVVALAQLNRRAAQDGGAPALHHLRESSRLEQDADAVLLLSRPAPGDQPKDARGNACDYVRLEVAKHRHGETGALWVDFQKDTQRMEDRGAVRKDGTAQRLAATAPVPAPSDEEWKGEYDETAFDEDDILF